MAKVKVLRRGRLTAEERERGFDVRGAPAPLPTYDALRDGNLRQYFESKTVQRFLQHSGWIDKEGRIVDLDKFRCGPACPGPRRVLCLRSSGLPPACRTGVTSRRAANSLPHRRQKPQAEYRALEK